MIACLPMYFRPELQEAHRVYWSAVHGELREREIRAPSELSATDDMMATWLSPTLVLGQTCGMPYRLHLHGKVRLVGTPDYGVDECGPGYYRSAVVVRADDEREQLMDFRQCVLAYNQLESQSGYAAAYNHCKASGFWFTNQHATGSHLGSALAVIEKKADIAFIDAVTWKLLNRYESSLQALRVLDWTASTPGLPYIASSSLDELEVFDAVYAAINKLPEEVKSQLQLRGIVKIASADYLAVPNPEP